MRDALKAFAAANTGKIRQSGRVTLPNGLTVALSLEADIPDAAKRDAWLKAHLVSKNSPAQ